MTIRSRRAGLKPEDVKDRPLYARVLGLQYLRPSGMLCFFFFEGAIALATLLALAELVSWWAIVVLPLAVALMVKINDVIAGFGARAAARARGRAAIRSAARQAAQHKAAAARQAANEKAGRAVAPVSPAVPAVVYEPLPEPVYELLPGPAEEPRPVVGRASIPLSMAAPQPLPVEDELRSAEARRRQSASHRYD
jgi:hypothetical protein